jgi:hypothetical protein
MMVWDYSFWKGKGSLYYPEITGLSLKALQADVAVRL